MHVYAWDRTAIVLNTHTHIVYVELKSYLSSSNESMAIGL